MIEQSRETQRRIIAAQIPPRLRGLSLLPDEQRPLEGLRTHPSDTMTNWSEKVLSGAVVAAQGRYKSCGRGVWAMGAHATAYLTATMRDIMVQEPFRGFYLSNIDYLDSMRPDGDRRYELHIAEDHLLVLANVGTEPMTDWTRATVASLILKRFEAGFPTLVAATCAPSEYLPETLAQEIFLRVGIMDSDD
jgi:hypothetical protein